MKRMLSVILSLALLASALIIPMSVSAVSGLTAEAAYAQLNAAVDGLKLDLANNQLTQVAYPDRSITAGGKYNETASQVSDVTDGSLTSICGSKTVKILTENRTEGDYNGLVPGHLHAVEYPVTSRIFARDIGYLVMYVNTNRSFKMSIGVHDEATGSPNIINGDKAVSVSATNGDYQAVAFNLTSVDWVNGNGVYLQGDNNKDRANKMYLSTQPIKRYIPSIQEMTDGNGDITSEDNIVFGSIFYVPVDTNVRDFKFTYNITDSDVNNRTIAQRFTELSTDMVFAAEKITNDDGRYTAESFAELQTAIKNAKATLIADSATREENAVVLFKAAAANLYKLEEVFRPKFVETGSDENSLASTTGNISSLRLTDDQRKSFGDYVAAVTSTNNRVHLVDKDATSRYPAQNTLVKNYANYDNLYLAVYNSGETQRFGGGFFNQYSDGCAVASAPDSVPVVLNNGYNLIDMYYGLYKTWSKKQTITYITESNIIGANRFQVNFSSFQIPEATTLYFGSILGRKNFDNALLNGVSSIADVVKCYAANIAGKGYENSAAVEEIMELLGITTVQVVKELDDTIGINYHANSAYTLETAVVGEKVSFSLTNVPNGVTVTVKYGDDVITDDNSDGYYEITVAKGKVLTIIPSHKVTEGTSANINITDENNVSKLITPWLYVTKGNSRYDRTASVVANLATLSDGTTNASDVNITDGNGSQIKFNNGSYFNNYTPGVAFDFNQESYEAYADLVFDLGRPTDIYKFQHIAISRTNSMGVYQLYASESATNLFSKESLICNYQNMNDPNKISQEIEFPTRTAQYVAVRCYMPIIRGIDGFGYCFRIKELAIYGTPTNDIDYKVTEIFAPTSSAYDPTDVEDGDLLNDKTFKSIKAYEDGVLKGTENRLSSTDLGKLNSQNYYANGHANIDCGVRYYSGGICKNGYSFDRSNINGNIVFSVPTAPPKAYYDFTYDLGDYYAVNRVDMYTYSSATRRVQAYAVYIGNDLETLYEGEPVAVYNNYYNIYGQKITFDNAKIGKYVGYRVLNPGTANDDNNTYLRIDELAAYGKVVGAPDDSNLAPAEITSNSVYILNAGGKSIYTSETDGTERTALRLTVGYKSPKDANGFADASKIVLANKAVANVIQRDVIIIAKSKYDSLTEDEKTNLNIHTNSTGLRVSSATATSEEHNVSNYFKSEKIKDEAGNVIEEDYRMTYGALNLNNISKTNAESGQVVVRGRVVYEYNGEIYAVYSPISGIDACKEITAQAAYNKLPDQKPTWFN